jgi:hypothetical protein
MIRRKVMLEIMIRIVFPDLGGCRVDVVKIAKKIQMCKPLPKKNWPQASCPKDHH